MESHCRLFERGMTSLDLLIIKHVNIDNHKKLFIILDVCYIPFEALHT